MGSVAVAGDVCALAAATISLIFSAACAKWDSGAPAPDLDGQIEITLDFVVLIRSHNTSERNPLVLRYFSELNSRGIYRFDWFLLNGGFEPSSRVLLRPQRYLESVKGHDLGPSSEDLTAMMMFGLDFVLALDPVPRWTLVTTSDGFLNMRELPGWLDELNAEYDVDRDCAFIANGMTWPTRKPWMCFPQGGAGYLLNRFTVRQLAANWASFLALGPEPCEDVRLGLWLAPDGGAPCGLTVTNRMLGHRIKNFRRRCPKRLLPGVCPAVTGRLREVVVWHFLTDREKRSWTWEAVKGVKQMNADPEVFWGFDRRAGHFPWWCVNGTV